MTFLSRTAVLACCVGFSPASATDKRDPNALAHHIAHVVDQQLSEITDGGVFYRGTWSTQTGDRTVTGDLVYGREGTVLLNVATGRYCRRDTVLENHGISCSSQEDVYKQQLSLANISDPRLGRRRASLSLPSAPHSDSTLHIDAVRVQPTTAEALQVWGILQRHPSVGGWVKMDNVARWLSNRNGMLSWSFHNPRWEGGGWAADVEAQLTSALELDEEGQGTRERATFRSTLQIDEHQQVTVAPLIVARAWRERCSVVSRGTRAERLACTEIATLTSRW